MMTTVHRTHPQAYLTAARFPPAIGAVLQALRDLEISIDDQIFRNIEASKGIVLQKETANPARG
jgi:hypothetical protein